MPNREYKEGLPAALGFRMPAEWHPHEATWLAWPKDPATWPDRIDRVQRIYLQVIERLAQFERIELLVDGPSERSRVQARLDKRDLPQGSVRIHVLPTADAWIRDYGPNFLLRSGDSSTELAINDWEFNAWGGKYEELRRDSGVPARLASILGLKHFRPGMILEGGAIDVNGAGICMTTEQCLLNPNRNPDLSREEIESRLRDYLNVVTVLWLGSGIEGDDTDGHVDDIARFVSEQTVVCAVARDRQDPNFGPLRENLERLLRFRDPEGHLLRVVELPMPEPIEGRDGILPASYANFYIANGLVLVPAFGQPTDDVAQRILQVLFPDRRVLGLPCEDLVWGMGAIHCLSQQQPASAATATQAAPRGGNGTSGSVTLSDRSRLRSREAASQGGRGNEDQQARDPEPKRIRFRRQPDDPTN